MKHRPVIIIDFDSTFVKVESLDLLADIIRDRNKDGNKIAAEIKEITRLGMEGKIPFEESLSKRIKLLKVNKTDIGILVDMLGNQVSDSIKNNRAFFRKMKNRIFIISGGFKDLITPVVSGYGITPSHIFANNFVYGAGGVVAGLEKGSPLLFSGGKVKIAAALARRGPLYVIGDGITDYEIRAAGHAEKFFAFRENTIRREVAALADYTVSDFDGFIRIFTIITGKNDDILSE